MREPSLKNLSNNFKIEKAIITFLLDLGLLKEFKACPFCKNKLTISLIRRFKYKCKLCKKEWSIRKDSPLACTRAPLPKIASAYILYSRGMSKLQVSKEIKSSYNTINRIIKIFKKVAYNE